MPILAVDSLGRIYSTSPDRSDGLGYGDSPECVGQHDLTLGSAYLKSQARQRDENIRRYRQNQMVDAMDREALSRQQFVNEARRRSEEAQAKMYENPMLVQAITKKAHQQAMSGAGCECAYETAMSGNAMTANGQNGYRGMSRDQQAIHSAAHGLGRNPAHAVDPVELRQLQHKLEAERILRLKARR